MPKLTPRKPVKTSAAETATDTSTGLPTRHRVLVVDAESATGDFLGDYVAARGIDCEVLRAQTVEEARLTLAQEPVTLLVTDLKLPDGKGLSLLTDLRRLSPHAGVVVTGKAPKVSETIEALRGGAGDFIPKPFTHEQLGERMQQAMTRQDKLARNDKKIARLRDAVRRLSEARRTVARKVDLLCNDLVGAYGELSRQVDAVRVQEDFRKLCNGAKDLEQLLCHAMDWVMRRVGYANIAVFLAADEDPTGAQAFQLGAYVKYTMQSTPEMSEAIREGLVRRAGREGFVRMTADEAARELTAAELRHLRGQAVVAANCTYLGESLATLVLFRDGAAPFTTEDADTFRAIAPIFAIALAGQVRGGGDEPSDEYEGEPTDTTDDEGDDKPRGKKKQDRADADWWKRGEPPPF